MVDRNPKAMILSVVIAVALSSFVPIVLDSGEEVDAETTSGSSVISQAGPLAQRTVSYEWYDMFNVSLGEWYDARWVTYHMEQPLTNTYPHIFKYYGQPPGNIKYYTNMRLDVTGREMTELNMSSHPEFLPFLGTTRGGNATIDWYMQYLTIAEMQRYPNATAAWYDGWVISLNGTTTMDKQAAMAVLDVTSPGYDDFATWWSANEDDVEAAYAAWLLYEGNTRLDIYNMYDYPLTFLTFNLTAQKVADRIVLSYDIVTWGMESLMTKWLRDAFMPTEWYFEDFRLNASIGPDMANLDINTAVAYAAYAWETVLAPGGLTSGEPCWVWEGMLQDRVVSSLNHQSSDFDPYILKTYLNKGPGSSWHGLYMPYDYVPGAWNLSVGEVLSFIWPSDIVQFERHVGPDAVANETGHIILSYSEPFDTDLPVNVALNDSARTVVFNGPLDIWTWSKEQMAHTDLWVEWQRLEILPRGMPYLQFKMDANTPPRADVSSSLIFGDLTTVFEFNASRSYDLEDRVSELQVRWDWDNDGTWDTAWSSSMVEQHIFTAPGIFPVQLEVMDSGGMTNLTYVSVEIMEEIPEFSSVVLTVIPALFLAIFITRMRLRKRTRGELSSQEDE